MSIRIEDFQCEGLLPILESFPTYRSAIDFVMAFRPSFIKSPQNIALQTHFTEHVIEYNKWGYKVEKWLLDGVLHRNNGPALMGYYKYKNKIESKTWCQNNKCHRNDGPAWIYYYENDQVKCKQWYQDDKIHRNDGPAWIRYYGDGRIESEQWYINGTKLKSEYY